MECNCLSTGLVAAGIVAVCIVLWKKFTTRKFKKGPKDTVVLYQFTRGPWAPSLSPYPIKLETYLRMTDIPYQSDNTGIMSKKSKIPWMTYNDDEVADSQFCIEYLNKKLDVDANSHLTAEEKAIARAFRKLVEDDLYWSMVAERWVFNVSTGQISKFFGLPRWLAYILRRRVSTMVNAQGIGRHSHQEAIQIGTQNIQAISDFIGKKPYLMGDQPCEEDCSVFGMLCQIRWQMENSEYNKYMMDKCPNLIAYVERMKEKFWPDWDECITHGGTKKALK